MLQKSVRTTITIPRAHQVLLRTLAAKRGQRGYSQIVAEALEFYFAHAPEVNTILAEIAHPRSKSKRD